MEILIGIDVGTTHLKAAAFTARGEPVAMASAPTPTRHLAGGGGEYEPEELWAGVAQCLARVAGEAGGAVAGVGVASMAEAGVLLDAGGRPVHPFIAWFDPRSREQAERLAARPGVAALFLRTGLYVQAKHGLCKLLWLKERRPEAFVRGAAWLGAAEYIAFRLTGGQSACPTLAGRTLGYDLERGGWAEDLLAELGIPAGLFPPLLPEGELLGTVAAEAGAATLLPPGTPVALAGHDHPCAALAAGVTSPGTFLDSTGTAEAVLGAVARPVLTETALRSQISQGPLPVPGLYALQAGAPASGGSLEWLRREILGSLAYEALEEEAATAGEDPSGLLYLPYLAGSGPPAVDPKARGALVGLAAGTTRGRVIKAIVEGTCHELRLMLEAMEELAGLSFARIVVTGGQARSPLWLQLKADILGRRVAVPEVAEATLLGAALLGGVAGGIFADAAAAAAAPGRRERLVPPRPRAAAQYGDYHRAYRDLRAALRPLYRTWPADPDGSEGERG